MQLPVQTAGIAPLEQWHPGPHVPGPHGPHWGGGPATGAGMGGQAFGPGIGGWWLVLLVAVLLIGVVAAALFLRREVGADGGTADVAVARLRERYAAGDLDDEEFERRRDRLTGPPG